MFEGRCLKQQMSGERGQCPDSVVERVAAAGKKRRKTRTCVAHDSLRRSLSLTHRASVRLTAAAAGVA